MEAPSGCAEGRGGGDRKAVERFEALKRHDAAWAELSEGYNSHLEEAGRRDCLPFDLEGWDALVDMARVITNTEDVPDGAKQAAKRVLDEDRSCREARAEIEAFRDGAKRHGEFWDPLRAEAEWRDIPTIDLPAYRPLEPPERALRETGRAILDDEPRLRPPPRPVPGRPGDRRRGARPAR